MEIDSAGRQISEKDMFVTSKKSFKYVSAVHELTRPFCILFLLNVHFFRNFLKNTHIQVNQVVYSKISNLNTYIIYSCCCWCWWWWLRWWWLTSTQDENRNQVEKEEHSTWANQHI